MNEALLKERTELLVDHIMKKCLWQFHSRAWDRERQNAGILGQTTQLLCGETVALPTPSERCHWVDAVCLAEAFKARFDWLATLDTAQIKTLMQSLHARMDHLTITGSLNKELTDQHY
ncbi:MAG: Fe-only nitrogenase subunit delta [Rhodocyclaceae bacterium]